jgi:protein SCO1/2
MNNLKIALLILCVGGAVGLSIFAFRQSGNIITAGEKEEFAPKILKPEVRDNEPDSKTVDYSLMDQDGKSVKLYSDLLKDKIVVMNFIFTNCKVVCDAQGKNFSKLQSKLGSRLKNQINLISLSKDPLNDTPVKLKQWGTKYDRQNGWTLLTGEKSEIDKTFLAFTGGTPLVIEHSAIMLIGNANKNQWIRLSGLEPIDEVEKLIEQVR